MAPTNTSIWGMLVDLTSNDIFIIQDAGVPTNGGTGTGAGITGPGSLYIDRTNKTLYQNTNTKLSPTWTLIAVSAAATVTLTGAQLLTNKTLTAPGITAPAIIGATTIGDGASITSPILTFDVLSLLALGTNQGNAALITATAPGNVLATGADATKGIRLPAATIGKVYNIKNSDAANAVLKVYPATGETINALAADAAISMAAKTSATFMCVVAGAWLTIPLVPS